MWPEGEAIDRKLRELLEEDVGPGDVTTRSTVPEAARASGRLLARTETVVSGLPVARHVFTILDSELDWRREWSAGTRAAAGATLASVEGRAAALLTGERVALNLLQRMCGIATMTRRFVNAIAGTRCRIFDTRKTAPGLRVFDRMAVADGGGSNHRAGLYDQVLIKDNHRRLAGGAGEAVRAARRQAPPGMTIEVEVETEEELRQALAADADVILIDNQTAETVGRWSRIARQSPKPPTIEASGNMTLERVRAYAEAGADRISVGALTHSVVAADISLELEAEGA
ncbi:MAG TPA: carboxylating nicotinate-nucleotide diphosphorylase [Thermoanaerobaculia bacterium]|jgi:nicotinate-nucleotide pyrophosphorylase (carboxylating)